jgi:hypothetical protein
MARSSFLVYGLTDPRGGEIRYVGKSTTGMIRPAQHGFPSSLAKENTHKSKWIRQLQGIGMKYGIVVLEELASVDGLYGREQAWIDHGRMQGWPLTNSTDGGPGTTGRTTGEETKRKISEANRAHPGHQDSEERREQKRVRLLNLWRDAKYRERMLGVHVGRRRSPETRMKISERARGRVISDEARKKLSAAGRLRYSDPAERLKCNSRPMLGKHHSPESRERISATKRARNIAREWGCAL